MKTQTILRSVLVAITINLGITANGQAVNIQDSLALVDFYNSTNGPGWVNNSNWLTAPVPTWYGITVVNSRVTQIYMEDNNLTGSIPASIGNLTGLTGLFLISNNFNGGIPAEIGNLTNLSQLILLWDHLTGSIPPELGKLSNVTDIMFEGNQLSGNLPPELGNLSSSKLLQLDLWDNRLTGSIPPELGKLANLDVLYLQSNQFTGSIPPELGNLKRLSELRLSGNQLTGSIPVGIANIHLVHGGELNSNRFTFDGMELIAQNGTYVYSPQARIAIHQNDNNLSVSAGGTLGNNTYHWYRVSGNETIVQGDSVFQPLHSGKYFASITNSLCVLLTLHTDTVNFVAPAPVISAVTGINSSQAYVYWHPFTNAVSYVVRRYKTGSTDYADYLPVTDTFRKINNMSPNTNYELQVKAYLANNDSSDWSPAYNFTTADGCTAPSQLRESNITDTSVKLWWELPPSAVKDFKIRYKESALSEWSLKKKDGAATRYILKGLKPSTSYNWQIRSMCTDDVGEWVKGPDFTTAASFAVATNTAINAIANTKNTMMISPNPNKGNFNLQLQLPVKTSLTTLLLYNNVGQLVWQQNLGNIAGAIEKNITLQNKLSEGLYTLTVQRSDLKMNQKIVIAR